MTVVFVHGVPESAAIWNDSSPNSLDVTSTGAVSAETQPIEAAALNVGER